MRSSAKIRSGKAYIALPLLALLILAGCSTPPSASAQVSSEPPASPPAETATVAGDQPSTSSKLVETEVPPPLPPAEKPDLSDSQRLPPAPQGILVLGLPEASLPAELLSREASSPAPTSPSPPPPSLPAEPAPSAPLPTPPPEAPVLPSPAPPPAAAPATRPPAIASAPQPSPSPPSPASAASRPASTPAPASASIKPPPAPASPPNPTAAQAAAKVAASKQAETALPSAPAEASSSAAPASKAPLALQPYLEASGAKPEPRLYSVELGQTLDIGFSGTGWTYLGEKDGRDGLQYMSRRFQDNGVLFSLGARSLGDFSLRFQRQDLLKGLALDEIVRVSVLPKRDPAILASSSPATGSSPSPPLASGSSAGQSPSPAASGAELPSAPSPGTAAPPSSPAALSLPDSPEGLLRIARAELGAGRAAETLAALERFLLLYPVGMDEVYLLLGRACELNSPYRDVRKAYDAYKKLREDYPQSAFWNEAAERVAYIERQYFEIR